jgi:hypothetical protein
MDLLLPVQPPGLSIETLHVIWMRTLPMLSHQAQHSWYGVTDLRSTARWSDLIRTHTPSDVREEASLANLGASLRSGSVARKRLLPAQLADSIPVITAQAVRTGEELTSWAIPRAGEVVGRRGDVVMTSTGTRLQAKILSDTALVAEGLILARHLQPGDAQRLAAYVNHGAGQEALRQLVTGDFIPHLTIRALGDLRVPREITSREEEAGPELLADVLEHALWTLSVA